MIQGQIQSCRECFGSAGWEQETPVWCLGWCWGSCLGHTAGEGFPLHAAGLQAAAGLQLFAHPAQLPGSAEAASPRREGMLEPCSLSTTWRVLGPEFSPDFPSEAKEQDSINHLLGSLLTFQIYFCMQPALSLPPIIPQEEQDFWFVGKTFWVMSDRCLPTLGDWLWSRGLNILLTNI